MTPQEAEQEWRNYYGAIFSALGTHQAIRVISDFKAALKARLEEKIEKNVKERNQYQKKSVAWHTHDLIIGICSEHIELIDEVKPLK